MTESRVKDAVTCSAGRSSDLAIGKAASIRAVWRLHPIHSHLKVTLHNLAQKSESLRHGSRTGNFHNDYRQSAVQGEEAKVTGTANGDTISVKSRTAAK
jgi:hypothetical protein